MATSYIDLTGDGNNNKNFSFPSYQSSDVKVEVDNVVKTVTTHYNITNYTTTGGGTVVFTSGNIPAAGTAVRIYRDTDVSTNTGEYDPKHTFSAGSSVKAGDLNNNQKQALYAIWEEKEQTITTADIKDSAVTTAKIKADNITGALIADDQINSEHYVADSIDTEHYAPNSVDATAIADDAVGANQIAGDAINGTHIGDDVINSEHYVAASIDAEHLSVDSVSTDKIVDDAVTYAKIQNVSATDRILGRDSSGAGVIEEITPTALRTMINVEDGATADQTNAEIRAAVEAASDSNVFTDADHSKLNAIEASADVTDATNVDAAGAVMNSDTSTTAMQFVVDEDNMSSNSATKVPTQQSTKAYITATSQPVNANLTTLAGMESGTASVLSSSTALTSTTAELNLLDGKSIVTSISSPTDVQLPTAQAVEERIVDLVTDVGGFRPIANETSFPATNPDPDDNAGTIVSVKALASNLTSNGSGVATIANGAGSGNTVTINGMANSDTIEAGKGILVETTSTLHTYTFHRETLAPADITSAASAVSDFNNRYRILASGTSINTVGSLDDGDLLWDSNVDKMKVYDATASEWKEVTSTGDFKYLYLCPDGGSGSPSFPGTSYDLREGSNSGTVASVTSAAQLLVSINGVIQKANTGTSAPAEGFAMADANNIKFGSAIASTDSVFIVQIGSAISVPVPGDDTVSTIKIQNNAINGDKIADDAVGAEHIEVLDANLQLADNVKIQVGTANDLEIYNDGTDSHIYHSTAYPYNDLLIRATADIKLQTNNTENAVVCNVNGAVELYHDNNKKLNTRSNGIDVTGNIYPTGHIPLQDDQQVILGGGDDLRIYHSSSSGKNIYQGASHEFWNAAGNEPLAKLTEDGAVELYYDDKLNFSTTGSGIKVSSPDGEATLQIEGFEGNAATLQFNADEGDDHADFWRIRNGTGTDFSIENYTDSAWEKSIECNEAGNVELYYDNSKRLETTSTGILISGSGPTTTINGFTDLKAASGLTLYSTNDTDGSQYGLMFAGADHDEDGCNAGIIANHENVAENSETTTLDFYTSISELYYRPLHLDNGVRVGPSGPVSSEIFTVQRTGAKVAYFDKVGSGTEVGVTMRHGRGLSGYTGDMVSFLRADSTEVGKIVIGASSTGYNTSSDYRLKENQVSISDGITRLKSLKPYKFNFKDEPDATVDGFFAHEVQSVVPNAISGTKDEVDGDNKPIYQSIDHSKLIPLLTAALQEAITKIETLETKVTALEAG